MYNIVAKDGLDVTFRLNVVENVIVKILKECSDYSENQDVLLKFKELAYMFEEKVFNRATSKADYLAKIHQKLNNMERRKTIDALAAPSPGIQLNQGQAAYSNQAQQNLDGSSLLQQNVLLPNEAHVVQKPMLKSSLTMRPVVNQLQPENQVENQSTLPSVQQYKQKPMFASLPTTQPGLNQLQRDNQLEHQNIPPAVHQYRPMTEPNCMPNMERYQQSHQLLSQRVVSQEQRIYLPHGQLQRSYMPSTSLYSQSKLASTIAPSASASSNAESINFAEWQDFILQFQRARSTYLPELLKLQRIAEEQCFQGQNMKQVETGQYYRAVQQMIKFLHSPESELIHTPKELAFQFLNKIVQYFCPDGQIGLNDSQTTPSDSTTVIDKSIIPSTLVEDGSSHLHTSSLSAPVYDPLQARKKVKAVFPLHSGPEGTTYKNTYLNAKQNPQLSQSEKTAASLNTMLPPMAKAKYSTSQQKSLGAHPISDKLPQRSVTQTEKMKNASSISGSRTISQPGPLSSTIDSPSTPMTPSSVPTEVSEKFSESVSPMKFRASKTSVETNTGDKSLIFETREAPASSLPSYFKGSESTQLSHDERQPFERLIQAVQLLPKETLRSSMDDIASVLNSIDKLPNYANDVTPSGKLKRNIDSVRSGYSSTWDSHGSRGKKPRHETNRDLLDEIREINQRLIETLIEVEFDSHSSDDTVIKCTYKPVISELFKTHFTPILPALSVKLLVPSCYPNSPPKILDKQPVGCYKESKNLVEKAKSRFDVCVRGLVSLGEMVQVWNDCARSVFSDYVLGLGGETFSTKYGTWECVPVA